MYNTYDVHFYSGVSPCTVEDRELKPIVIDRQTDRQLERQTDRQAERQIDICQSVSQLNVPKNSSKGI
jgi:hypothetical protein